jgi:hypothetical protein
MTPAFRRRKKTFFFISRAGKSKIFMYFCTVKISTPASRLLGRLQKKARF